MTSTLREVTTLIVARHGNTFAPGETPRRVGLRTDLPLVPSGVEQAHRLGRYLYNHLLAPDQVYTSELMRARQTAQIALTELGRDVPVRIDTAFNEIDYGADENQPEDVVRARLGDAVMAEWEDSGLMPSGWSPSSYEIRENWANFSENLLKSAAGKKTLVVTSNGIARFALALSGDWDKARTSHGLKLATGAFGVLTRHKEDESWTVVGWNIRP